VTSYIESAAGVAAGARTGLGNVAIAGLFIAAIVLRTARRGNSRLRHRSRADSGGRADVRHRSKINWEDFTDAFPAFMTIVATPLTFSIATGLSLGLLSYTFIKVGTGKYKEISPLIWGPERPIPGPLRLPGDGMIFRQTARPAASPSADHSWELGWVAGALTLSPILAKRWVF